MESPNRYILKEDFNKVKNSLVKLLYFTYSLGCVLGIDLDKSFDIVHKSNMSKLCLTQEEAQDTVKWYVKNELRYDSPNFRKSDDNKYYVIYNQSSGKILKSINYNPAKFDSLL